MMQNEIQLVGKYANPKIYAETIDQNTIGQVMQMGNEEAMKDTTIRILPDAHYGKGSTVGTSIRFKQGIKRVVPDIVGVDIACSISAVKINKTHLDDKELKHLDTVINQYIPAGQAVHGRPTNRIDMKKVDNIIKNITLSEVRKGRKQNRVRLSVGTLGGGNHYIAIEKYGDDYWLMIHSGSRTLGSIVAQEHQTIADNYHDNRHELEFNNHLQALKDQNKPKEIQKRLNEYKQTHHKPNLRFLEGQGLDDYLNDMHLTQQFAVLSHEAMQNEILHRMGWDAVDRIHSMHNYIDIENNIIRKGATDASNGTRLIIPFNMRDGSVIAVGKGNEDWNYSAPHGAGRVLSRTAAKDKIDLQDYEETMKDIFTTSVGQSTLDEAPDAYKSKEEILRNTVDTLDVLAHTTPVYNFKAH